MKCFIYYNLHKHCWSVRNCKTRRVIKHCDRILLRDAVFKVSQAGRERVLKEKRKNVHAGVEGFISSAKRRLERPVRYNPYIHGFFFDENERPVKSAAWVLLENGRVFI